MRVLIHDTLATLFYAQPARLGWLESTTEFDVRDRLTAADVGPADAALLASPEIARLAETHLIVPSVAVIFDGDGPVAMRAPVRPDEIEQTVVALNGVSSLAETLARASLEPYYGIRPTEYLPESAEARVSLLEGIETLLPVEAGFQESLARAWFVMTGEPAVAFVLAAPKSWPSERIAALARELTALRELGRAKRSELRQTAAAEAGIERDLLVPVFGRFRYALDDPDRRALLMLLQRGNKGSNQPYVWSLDYFEVAPASE